LRQRIVVVMTGGTIAALGSSPAASTIYKLEADVNPLLQMLPALTEVADIETIAFAHVPSHDLSIDEVLALARQVAARRADGSCDGIVVAHGTDTLEETAYLLDLLLPAGAPVVLTGAARPTSALSADGPFNLLQAVRVAASPAAAGMGVLVCLNDRIACARSVTKAHTSATDAFRAPEEGFVGAVMGDEVRFYWGDRPGRPHFALSDARPIPRVDIVYSSLGMSPRALAAAIEDGVAGIVIAATGNGSMAAVLKPELSRAREKGIAVVRASRVGSGFVTAAPVDEEFGTIPAGALNPQKARLLLMLALRETGDVARLAAFFRSA